MNRRAIHGMSRSSTRRPRSGRSARLRVARSRQCRARLQSLVLLDDLLQIVTHRLNRNAADGHFPIRAPRDDGVESSAIRTLFRVVVAEMSASTFFSLESRTRDRFRHSEKILQIERSMPPRIVLTIAGDAHSLRSRFQSFDSLEGAPHFLLASNNADQLLHHFLKCVLNLIRTFRGFF